MRWNRFFLPLLRSNHCLDHCFYIIIIMSFLADVCGWFVNELPALWLAVTGCWARSCKKEPSAARSSAALSSQETVTGWTSAPSEPLLMGRPVLRKEADTVEVSAVGSACVFSPVLVFLGVISDGGLCCNSGPLFLAEFCGVLQREGKEMVSSMFTCYHILWTFGNENATSTIV